MKQCYLIVSSVEKNPQNPKFAKIKNERIMLLSECAACNSNKLKFIKE